MPSPFPGMNPYFEQDEVWHDFHQAFVPRMRESLVEQVRSRYIVKLVLRAVIGEPAKRYECFSGIAVDTVEESCIEIRSANSRQLVTTIELLSPANKYSGLIERPISASDGSTCWLEMPTSLSWICCAADHACRSRGCLGVITMRSSLVQSDGRMLGFGQSSIRDALPVISVPLLAGDADARLDLQQLLHSTYDKGGYENYIYESSPSPALNGSDAEWAAEIVARVH